MSIDNLSHTSWKCKYHIVFTLKYRRQAIYSQLIFRPIKAFRNLWGI